MTTTVYSLYDPLCGWCYGAMPALAALRAAGVNVELLPSGLFLGAGARAMDDTFAAYAWTNDQRIVQLTGQRFTEQYRQHVLADRQQRFDSGPATLALTAVAQTEPAREWEALDAIQQARYVDGKDVTVTSTLAGILQALGLQRAAAQIAQPDAALIAAAQARIATAHSLLQAFDARGVPTLIAQQADRRWLLDTREAYGNPQALLGQLRAA